MADSHSRKFYKEKLRFRKITQLKCIFFLLKKQLQGSLTATFWQSKIADPDQQDPQDPNYKFLI